MGYFEIDLFRSLGLRQNEIAEKLTDNAHQKGYALVVYIF